MADINRKRPGSTTNNKTKVKKTNLALSEAIELGEYDPDYLATFPEWQTLSPHIRFEFIRKAIENRHKQLITYYAELNNVLELSKKPHVRQAMRNVEKLLSKFEKDRERLLVEYSTKL